MQPALEWNRMALMQSPLFGPLHAVLAGLGAPCFPSINDLNALLAHRSIATQNNKPLRFVEQQSGKLPFEQQYEPRCYLTGDVPTRSDNWHDLFNALVWLTFPKTKAALNARHYAAMTGQIANGSGASQRGSVRDVNTLLDESGVIVTYADVEMADLLRNFQWKELFWQRRQLVQAGMGFYIFGHGLYEKALQPYVGMTGQGLLLPVEPSFFSWAPALQLAHLDSLLADYLAVPENCCSTRELTPVPLLGVPGWAADNDNAAYYDNTEYFRAGRRGK